MSEYLFHCWIWRFYCHLMSRSQRFCKISCNTSNRHTHTITQAQHVNRASFIWGACEKKGFTFKKQNHLHNRHNEITLGKEPKVRPKVKASPWSLLWRCTPGIPALQRQRQENSEFKASLINIGSSQRVPAEPELHSEILKNKKQSKINKTRKKKVSCVSYTQSLKVVFLLYLHSDYEVGWLWLVALQPRSM